MTEAPTSALAEVAVASSPGRPRQPDGASSQARALADELGVSVTLADVLHRRGLSDLEGARRFLDPRLSDLSDPEPMADRALAADRLSHAVRKGERIAVFGDYDCDGITSSAITTGVIRALGGEVHALLASRFDGGYGLSPEGAAKVEAVRPSVLVTCDCGSSDHPQIERLKAAGIDVIVIDHHLVPDEPLPALAFLNPHRPECGFPYKGMASCGLALSLAAALRKALGWKLDLRTWLDLVAIGTIADVVPLDGDNRRLVRAGLERLARPERPGVRALLELATLRGAPSITGEDVAFRLAPRINAPGRMGPPDVALDLLLARTDADATALAGHIDQLQTARREAQEKILAEAIEDIERERWADRSTIVVGREGWNHGIVGIVAGQLVRRYERPVIVVGFQDGLGCGSARGPAGSRLYDALAASADCVERFGGHQAAAGVTVRLSRLGELREAFEAACASMPTAAVVDSVTTVQLDPDDDVRRVHADLGKLEPCGAANPAPELVLRAEVLEAREVKGGHLKLELRRPDGSRVSAFALGLGDRAGSLAGGSVVVRGKLRLNTWRGASSVELFVERLD